MRKWRTHRESVDDVGVGVDSEEDIDVVVMLSLFVGGVGRRSHSLRIDTV
jgi:hypothetical protein